MLKQVLSSSARRATPVFAALALAVQALAGGPDIAELAPPRSFLLVSVPSAADLNRAFDESEFGKLWNEPSVKRFLESLMEDDAEEFETFLKDVNIQVRDLKPPTGHAGLALFMPSEPKRDRKPWESPFSFPQALAVADFGPTIDDWEDALERLIDHGLKERRIRIEDDTYAGAKIRVIKPIYAEVNIPDNDRGFRTREETGGLGGILGGTSADPRNLYIARVDTTLIASSDIQALELAIDGLAGKATESAADEQNVRAAAAQRGAGELAYAAFLPGPFFDLMRQDEPDAVAMFDVLGITGVKAVSAGLKLNTPESSAEMTLAILAPEKTGMLNLLTSGAGAFDPPAFVPPDAADVGRLNVDFARIPDLVRAFARTMPREQQQMITGFLDQFANIIVPTLEAMGPQVHYITTYAQPLSAESAMQTYAIELRDQETVSNTITFLMSQAGGLLEARDFEGNTLYSSQAFPIAIGLGFNRLFIGSVQGVEGAMRLAGRADGGRITEEPRFRAATSHLTPGGIAYRFSDAEKTLRWTYWGLQNDIAAIEQELDEEGYTEEEKREFLDEYREERPKWMDQLPPLETVLRHIGDTVLEMHSTPDGFRTRTLMLKPARR